MAELKSKFDIIIERLANKGVKVTVIEDQEKNQIISKVEKTLEDYRFDNQRKIIESQEKIAQVVLTA
jgi:UDP-N-acetylmuramoylalanine-D-glutamate ligase